MEHRRDVQHHVIFRGAVRPHELEPVRGDVAVGETDSFRATGSPSGVEQEGIVSLDAGPPFVLRRSVAQRFVVRLAIALVRPADPEPRLGPFG